MFEIVLNKGDFKKLKRGDKINLSKGKFYVEGIVESVKEYNGDLRLGFSDEDVKKYGMLAIKYKYTPYQEMWYSAYEAWDREDLRCAQKFVNQFKLYHSKLPRTDMNRLVFYVDNMPNEHFKKYVHEQLGDSFKYKEKGCAII